ncbi:hypothetical protein ACWEN6_29985 [Sphaerisporangium sp. NPDC004334]
MTSPVMSFFQNPVQNPLTLMSPRGTTTTTPSPTSWMLPPYRMSFAGCW